MTREDVVKILREKGVSGVLLKMPAIIEQIYEVFLNLPQPELLLRNSLTVDENGDFTLRDWHYSVKDACCAEKTKVWKNYYDIEEKTVIQINKYGIETLSEYIKEPLHDPNICESAYGRRIVIKRMGDGTIFMQQSTFDHMVTWTKSDTYYFDTGKYSIEAAKGIEINKRSPYNEEVLTEIYLEAARQIKKYPQTEEWYKRKIEQVKAFIEKQNESLIDPQTLIKSLKDKIKYQETKLKGSSQFIDALNTQNKDLRASNEALQASIEELRASNAALQASIEELRASNETLQASNDELRARNDGLTKRLAKLIRLEEIGKIQKPSPNGQEQPNPNGEER